MVVWSIVCCGGLTAGYLISPLVWGNRIYKNERNTPSVIIKRYISIYIYTILCYIFFISKKFDIFIIHS